MTNPKGVIRHCQHQECYLNIYSTQMISLKFTNVNSIRHKFCELLPLTTECKVDILAIAETKLDDSFHSAQFNMCNYKLYRQDRNSHGGGIMIYVKDCIPHRLINEHTGIHMGVEFMTIELSVKSNKWKLCYIYRPPLCQWKGFLWLSISSMWSIYYWRQYLFIFRGYEL